MGAFRELECDDGTKITTAIEENGSMHVDIKKGWVNGGYSWICLSLTSTERLILGHDLLDGVT